MSSNNSNTNCNSNEAACHTEIVEQNESSQNRRESLEPPEVIIHGDYVVNCVHDDIPPPKADFSAPPPYEVAAALPTYEEVQQEKRLEARNENNPHVVPPPEFRAVGQRLLTINGEETDDNDTSLLGTDFMFYTAFFVAFIFNWIGFLLLMCFCHTIASRYGALSGFGLSLAKWTLIVKHSTDLASRDNSWLWWLIMTFGLIICIRAILQYLSIKRGWRMLTASHQERLLFFY